MLTCYRDVDDEISPSDQYCTEIWIDFDSSTLIPQIFLSLHPSKKNCVFAPLDVLVRCRFWNLNLRLNLRLLLYAMCPLDLELILRY